MKEEKSLPMAISLLNDFLVTHNYRRTPERLAILERIYEIEGHFDAELLYETMKQRYRVSKATVYNALELFVSLGLIVQHRFQGNTAQYEKSMGSQMHHHSICTHCGKVKEFSDKKIRKAIQARNFATFTGTHYALYIYGICRKCSKAKHNP